VRPSAAGAARLPELAPEGVLRAVNGRLARLPAPAAALARAVAVLGADARLRQAAALADLDIATAGEAADVLAGADVLEGGEPLAFRHALTAAAIIADLPASARAAAHLRAAALLRDEGAPPERLADHLLQAPATAQPWVVEALRAGATRALKLGAPQTAVELLRRALDEPPAADERRAVLLALGRAEAVAGMPDAGGRLAAAAALVAAPAERAQILRELARARLSLGDHAGARAAYDEALGVLNGDDPELKAHLRAEQIVLAAIDGQGRADTRDVEAILRDERVGDTAAGRALLATLAGHELYAGAPRDRVLALVDRALAKGSLLDDEAGQSTTVFSIALVLFVSEQLSRNEALLTPLVDRARRQGSVMGPGLGVLQPRVGPAHRRAGHRGRRGRPAGRRRRRPRLARVPAGRLRVPRARPPGRGRRPGGRAGHRRGRGARPPGGITTIQQLDARGRVHAVRGRHGEAAEAFLAAGEQAQGQRNPLLYATWRSTPRWRSRAPARWSAPAS
jgi:tetratricopeptide (TPR) repeat protein